MKAIPAHHFDELIQNGNTVPRSKSTGEPIPFVVGKEYIVKSDGDKRSAKVRCTQNCPYNLKLIKVIDPISNDINDDINP